MERLCPPRHAFFMSYGCDPLPSRFEHFLPSWTAGVFGSASAIAGLVFAVCIFCKASKLHTNLHRPCTSVFAPSTSVWDSTTLPP